VDLLFDIAGIALIVHIALCSMLMRGLRDNSAMLDELFAVPNGRIVGRSSFRLLRVRYYLPWISVRSLGPIGGGTRVILILAQISGLLMPICALSFLALATVLATR